MATHADGGGGGGVRRAVGRPVGGDSTRAHIIQVARQAFAEGGYQGTSLRGVAVATGVDPSTVVHFFKTKEGLFRATVEDVLPVLAGVVDCLVTGAPGVQVVRDYLGAYDDPKTGPALVAVLRTSAGSTDASGVVDDVLLGQVAARLPAGASPELRLGIELAMSQLVGLAVARHLAGMPHLTRTAPTTLAALVGPHLDALRTPAVQMSAHLHTSASATGQEAVS